MAAQGTDKEAAWVGGRDFIPHTNPQELTTAPTMMHDADSDRLAQQCGYPVQGKETRSNMADLNPVMMKFTFSEPSKTKDFWGESQWWRQRLR